MRDLVYAPIDDFIQARNTLLTLDRIPSPWLVMLANVQQEFPGAIIAGGCLRDTIMGKPVKDVDIFVQCANPDDVETALHRQSLSVSRQGTNYGSISGSGIAGVWGSNATNSVMGSVYQYIALANPFTMQTLLELFDIGLCMVATNGRDVHIADEFRSDMDNRTLTIYRTNSTGKSAKKHAYRIRAKYQGFTICDKIQP